jgi:hypothetical protein
MRLLGADVIPIDPLARSFTTTTICQLVGLTFRQSFVHRIEGLAQRAGRLGLMSKAPKAEQSHPTLSELVCP